MPVLAPVGVRSPAAVNRLLGAFPPHELRTLHVSLDRVRLTRGQLLAAPGADVRYAYFPLHGLLVMLATGLDGETAQVGMVGPEGVVGLPVLLQEPVWPYAVIAPVAGEAYRLPVSVLLRARERDATVQRVLLGCAQQQVRQMAQASVCHRCHTVLQRLSGWLLAAADAVGGDTIHITHDLLAQLLGTQRSAVSAAAMTLQDRGMLRQRHGRVQILQRGALRARACACGVASVRVLPHDGPGRPRPTSR